MELGKEINEEEFYKWIKALRSGKYKQTKRRLQDGNGYCCLGVACKELATGPLQLDANGYIKGSTFIYQNLSIPGWLVDINYDFGTKTYSENGSMYLTGLNDEKSFTFDEIADVLEAVYVHKVLD